MTYSLEYFFRVNNDDVWSLTAAGKWFHVESTSEYSSYSIFLSMTNPINHAHFDSLIICDRGTFRVVVDRSNAFEGADELNDKQVLWLRLQAEEYRR